MWTGVVMVGPKAGQRTECKAKDPSKCRYHKKGSHEEMIPQALDLFNENAAREMASARKENAAARSRKTLRKADKEANAGMAAAAASRPLPDDLAALAADLDGMADGAAVVEDKPGTANGAAADAKTGYDEAMKTVTTLHGTYDGSRELASMLSANASALRQAAASLEVNHPEWLDDPEVGPFVSMPGDEVEFRGPNGKVASTILRPGSRSGELLSSTGETMIRDGVMVFPGVSFVRLSKPAGMVAGYGSSPVARGSELKFAAKCPRGTELFIQKPDGQAGAVMLDGQGGVITEDSGETHRAIDLQNVRILSWRRPATYEERKAFALGSLRSIALQERNVEIAAENAAKKAAWENRSAVQRMIDRAKGRLLRPAPMLTYGAPDPLLFRSFQNRHPSLTAKLGFRLEDGKASIV